MLNNTYTEQLFTCLTALRIRPTRTSFVTTSSVQLVLCNKLTIQSTISIERSPWECNSRSVGHDFSPLSLNPKFQEQVLDPTLSHSRSAHIQFEIIIHYSGFTARIFCASVFPIQCYLLALCSHIPHTYITAFAYIACFRDVINREYCQEQDWMNSLNVGATES